MGYELWTSPVTGYRRHGTRLADFNDALGLRIMARDICEPLKCCASGAPADQMQNELSRLDFSVSGVRDAEDGPVTGFVRVEELSSRSVQAHLHPLTAATVIDDEVSLQFVLECLGKDPFLFVRTLGDISAILTWADLNKPIVRVYVFGLISLLEMHLSFWVAHTYSDGDWQQALTEGRLGMAVEVRQKRAALGQDVSLIQCLQMCDKRTLVSKSIGIRDQLGFESKAACERFLRDVEVLRDTLAHSQYELAPDNSWKELLTLVDGVNSVILRSDRLVENKALDSAAGFTGLLW